MKILLDTDIGNDIDDALCLAYLLAQPECELLGITTVTAGAPDRARLASAMCLQAGRQIPIAAGAEQPSIQEPPLSAQGLLARWPSEEPRADAVELMRDTIAAHAGEVTLLTIGALTNVAHLFGAYPETAAQLKSLVMMGGRYFTHAEAAEWNIRNDPAAASIVFGTPVPHLRAIGIDVTRQVFLAAEDFRSRVSGLLLDFAGPWLSRRDRVTFHDPLAAVSIFQPLCGYQRGSVKVEESGETVFTPDPHGPHEIAESVSPQRFFDHYFAVLQGHGPPDQADSPARQGNAAPGPESAG